MNIPTKTVRPLGLIAAILLIAGGVSYAALQSQPVKLTGNLIETANAGLLISNDGTTFTSSQTGFEFSNIVPGGAPQGNYSFSLRNSGNAAVALKFSVSSTPSNPGNVDLNKVNIILTPVGGVAQSFSLQALISANATGGLAITSPAEMFAGNRVQFTVQVSMASDAVVNGSAALGNIDFAITGVAVTS